MNYLTANPACKTISYPINKGFYSLCLRGVFYKISENIRILQQTNLATDVSIFCRECLLINSEITLFCLEVKVCSIYLWGFIVKDSAISFSNIYITFSNVSLQQTLIQDLANYSKEGNNQFWFEKSTLSCFQASNCGLYLKNVRSVQVTFLLSHLKNFILEICTNQLMFICHETNMTMPSINIKTRSFEYLKILTFIEFYKVTMNGSRFTNDIVKKGNRNVESRSTDYLIIFDLIHPYIVIKESYFIGVHVDILSTIQQFEPVFFSLSIKKCYIINSYHVGNGGGFTIVSEVESSEVKIVDSLFSNNYAVKGTGPLKGRGGGVYIKSESLTLIMIGNIFQENKADDLGLALYTTEGVDVSLRNCTFQYNVDPKAPIQQSLLFVSGKITEFQGLVHVFNPRPETYVGPIEIFYIGQGANLEIETYCPKWYSHVTEYTFLSTDSQALPDLKYKCSPCSDNYYTVGVKSNTLLYSRKENISLAKKPNRNQGTDTCLQCPYGALCTGNSVMPRPNYWGYWYEDELVFKQCPAGYCCPSVESGHCSVYDYCSGNKTGTLCGACLEYFSVSILSGACTSNAQCGQDQWFWFIALLAMMAYALWYTFKDDIFALAFGAITYVRRMLFCKRSAHKITNVPVMMPPDRQGLSISSLQNSQGTETSSSGIYNTHMQNEVMEKGQTNSQDDMDKGYFGIVAYYAQMAAVIRIQIEFSDIDKSESFQEKMFNYIGRFLNVELSQVSFDICPIVGLTTAGKHLFTLVFLLGIYVSWGVLFIILIASVAFLHKRSIVRTLESFKSKFVRGLIEIIKYTYAGFCSMIFMSLVCVQISKNYVWWYDGTNICMENWQIVIIIFAAFYAIPLPLALVLGLKLLKQNKISSSKFVCSCLCPPLAIYFKLRYGYLKKDLKIEQPIVISKVSKVIISVLQGPYRNDEMYLTLYWEAMVSVRRLLITGMTLVSYASIRMIIITALCLIFLIQHINFSPFQSRGSNNIETLSLSLLVMTSMINLLKASLTDSGVVPSGPSVSFFKSLELCERMFVVIIIAFILIVEIRLRKGNKTKISLNK